MSDLILRLSESKAASSVARALGLSLPQPLKRAEGPWRADPLSGRDVFFCAGSGAALPTWVLPALECTGAKVWAQGVTDLPGSTEVLNPNSLPERVRPHGLVFDATGLEGPEGLDELYNFFHVHVRGLAACGRAIVLVRPPLESANPLQRAARRAVEGFVRSMGRELGRKGSTAQTVQVATGSEDRLEAVLRFLLSYRSAYISGQTVRVSAVVAGTPKFPLEQALAGKVALVTGAARGIGEATARALAREGATVVVMDRPEELAAAQSVAGAIGGSALACDITDADAAGKILTHVAAEHGGLDIVVHNAGVTRDKTLANMDEARWNLVLDINLKALVRVNEGLADGVREGGRIICLSSIGGIAGNVGQTNYAATKAGVIGYIEGAAPRFSPRGITVNAVAPGFIETRMTAAIPLATREVARRLSNLSQGGLPEDIAEAITFLASPGASGITGETLRVCGGNFIGA